MRKNLFHYDEEYTFDHEHFERIFNHLAEIDSSLHQTLPFINKIFILSDWTNLQLTSASLLSGGLPQEDLDTTFTECSTNDWRGLCFYKQGVIVINMMEVIDSSDYYCEAQPLTDNESFVEFIKKESRLEDVESFTHDNSLMRQLIFWKTLFHEIRHIEQYHFPENMKQVDDEEDADQHGAYMYKNYMEVIERVPLVFGVHLTNEA